MSQDQKPNKKHNNRSLTETGVLESETVGPEAALVERSLHLQDFVSSLLHRDYRYFWIGAFLSNVGTWLQIVAVGWVIVQMTNSEFYLGLSNFASLAAVFFFALLAGLAADAFDRRRLIIITQVIMMFFAFVLGVLSSMRIITPNSIIVVIFASGIALAFNFPSWQAIVPDLVPRKDLLNAIALNSAQFNAARLIGPAFAGLILGTWGATSCFYLNGLSFIAVIFALMLIHPAPSPRIKLDSGRTIWSYLLGGIRYAREDRFVGLMLLTVGSLSILTAPYTTLMPFFAKNILKVGPTGYGFLLAASGLGAVLGAFLVAPLSRFAKNRTITRWGIIVISVFLTLFAFSRSFILSVTILPFVGGALLSVLSTINNALQIKVPNEIRGRVMSLYVMMFLGLMPFGSLAAGALAHVLSSPIAVTLGAAGCALLGLFLFANTSQMRQMDH